MPSIPNFSDVFGTIEEYRYSITVGLVLLYFAPRFFPLGWETLSATWSFVAALLFFLSLGMIIVEDFVPWVKRKTGIGLTEDAEKASEVLSVFKEKSGNSFFKTEEPPYTLEREELDRYDRIAKYCKTSLDPEKEVSVTEEKIVITKAGLETLKSQI